MSRAEPGDPLTDDRPAGDADLLIARAPDRTHEAIAAARRAGADVDAALDVARDVGAQLPPPGRATDQRWGVLAALARASVTVARVVEAHTDALAILAECDPPLGNDRRTWGVFAAEGGDDPLHATSVPGGVVLRGFKPWCSLADRLDAALITAHVDGGRQLFMVDLHQRGVRPRPATGWVSRGLPGVVSVGVDFDDVPAQPVGGLGWYLSRAGFAWGGMGVAACWYGAARGVADRLPLASGDDSSVLLALHRGRVDVALHAAACVLLDAAARVDAGTADGVDGAQLALRVRAVVADAVETVLREVGHATGPAPLTLDEEHAARVADLTVYVRQHHGERDLAALGRTAEAKA